MSRLRFPDHRGVATWGDSLVPIDEFRREALKHGRRKSETERESAIAERAAPLVDPTPVEGPFARVAVFGGVYSNHLALEALLSDVRDRGVEAIYCLGDLGGFGPNPEKVRPLIEKGSVRCIRGNYEESLAGGRDDCNCGYTDPRDNHFARVSYEYTSRNCSDEFKGWMGRLPGRRRIRVAGREMLLVHGSPRQVNEFLFRSTSPLPFLERLLDRQGADGLLCTHTGLHWHRCLPSGRDVVNVGAIGRPANDGRTEVRYAIIEGRGDALGVELVPLRYDHLGLAREMREAGLPGEFVETILTGWWTTCLEVLPAKERRASRF